MKKTAQRHRLSGLKLTPQRLAIMKIVEGSCNHPSAEDVFKKVRKIFPTISFKTVYSTLDTMCERKMIKEINIDPLRKRYCPMNVQHHHIMCTSCQKIVDVFKDFDISVGEDLLKGFTITEGCVSLYGLCQECSAAIENTQA